MVERYEDIERISMVPLKVLFVGKKLECLKSFKALLGVFLLRLLCENTQVIPQDAFIDGITLKAWAKGQCELVRLGKVCLNRDIPRNNGNFTDGLHFHIIIGMSTHEIVGKYPISEISKLYIESVGWKVHPDGRDIIFPTVHNHDDDIAAFEFAKDKHQINLLEGVMDENNSSVLLCGTEKHCGNDSFCDNLYKMFSYCDDNFTH